MLNTEIQTVEGKFSLPTGWPKFKLGDTKTGLIHDWDASSLDVGTLPSTGWTSSGSLPTTMKLSGGTVAPQVLLDPESKKKYVRFSDNQLTGAVSWLGDLTVVYVIRPDIVDANLGRVLSGPSGNFRGFVSNGNTFEMMSSNSVGTRSNTFATQVTPKKLTAIAGRWGLTSIDGKIIGGDWKSIAPAGNAYPQQKSIVIGANTQSPPQSNTFLKANVYRVMVWDRLLTDLDVESALADNSVLYGI